MIYSWSDALALLYFDMKIETEVQQIISEMTLFSLNSVQCSFVAPVIPMAVFCVRVCVCVCVCVHTCARYVVCKELYFKIIFEVLIF